MSEKLTAISKKEGKGADKKKVNIEVREIENGYIIRKSTKWQDPKKGWQYVTKEFFSKVDPLEIKTDDKSLAENFKD